MLSQTDRSTKVLVGWAIAQPFLYGQLSNFKFVAESLSIVGGLLLLRAHLVASSEGVGARIQLVGRLLIPAMYVYYAGQFLFSAFTYDETSNFR